MCAQGIVIHQLYRQFTRQDRVYATRDIDLRQFLVLMIFICEKFLGLAVEVGMFGVGL